MTTAPDDVDRWRHWADARAEHVIATAMASDLRGGGAWDALLSEAGVEPLSSSERDALVRTGPPRKGGPPPIEVRRALEHVATAVLSTCDALDASLPAADMRGSERVDRLRNDARRLVDTQLKKYIAAVRPRISTSSIFANAAASTTRMNAGHSGPAMATKTCSCCGAPRDSKSDMTLCTYCGATR